MIRTSLILGLIMSVPVLAAQGLSRDAESFQATLQFEVPAQNGIPGGWRGNPADTVSIDRTNVHSGEAAVRLDRKPDSEGTFSALTASIPIDFGGAAVELRGVLRMDDVSNYAGLWMRTDGPSGVLAFDSMQRLNINGTSDWTEYRIQVPLAPGARELVFGVLLAGTGTLWGDDLALFVDGVPISVAPHIKRELSVLETDQEFDVGSGISIDALTDLQIKNLVILGKVWGFLKYHHPRIARGELHWDYELFRVLPAVLDAQDVDERNEALMKWTRRIGEPAPCDPCAMPPEKMQLAPDIDWIRDSSILGENMVGYLKTVYRNRYSERSQFYVETDSPTVPHPVFKNELPYSGIELDTGHKLLGLFRFWNMVEYWFAYRDLIGEPWDDVLKDLLPIVAESKTFDDYTLAIFQLIARVNDTHTDLYGSDRKLPPQGECQLPVAMRFIGDQAVVAAYANDLNGPTSGLEIGDVLRELNGKATGELVDEWTPWYSASNEPTRLRNMAWHMTRGPCEDVELRLLRGGKELRTKATRVPLEEVNRYVLIQQDRPGETFQWLTNDVAYLKLSTIAEGDVESYMRQAQRARGLIIDVRSYPKEFVVFSLGRHLVTESVEFASATEVDMANPGAFTWVFRPSHEPAAPHYSGKVIVLVNEITQSQAEYTALALRATPNAIILGSTTAGTDGNLSRIMLPGGLGTGITGIGIFYPDGSPTQRVGIVPDVFVTPTIDGIRMGRDELLERALFAILGASLNQKVIMEIARSK